MKKYFNFSCIFYFIISIIFALIIFYCITELQIANQEKRCVETCEQLCKKICEN
jgi:YbbR domain-containing protein